MDVTNRSAKRQTDFFPRVKACVKKHTLYVSLMFIAVNPMGESEERVQVARSRQSDMQSQESASDPVAQKVVDYLKLGKLYLLQGDVNNSYNAFLMGETIDDGGAMSPQQFMSPSQMFVDPSLVNASQNIQKNTLDTYLRDLIALYVDRARMLMNDSQNYDQAQRELQKIFIIDPTNREAKKIEQEIAERQKKAVPVVTHKKERDVIISKVSVAPKQHRQEREVRVEKVVVPQQKRVVTVKEPEVLSPEMIERALIHAEEKISRSMLRTPAYEESELKIKKHYDQGKVFFQEGDYFSSVNEFKKVLAINPHHLYAEYARTYIEKGMLQIKATEERDLKSMLIVESEPDVVDGSDSLLVVAEESKPAEVVTVVPLVHSGQAMRQRKNELLKKQINNVLATIEIYLAESQYEKAYENIHALLIIDPDNEDAIAIKERMQSMIRAEEEAVIEGIRMRCVADEESDRAQYFARQEWRKTVREELEARYNYWLDFNEKEGVRALQKRIDVQLDCIQDAIDVKDYFGADKQLDVIFILDPEHREAQELEKTIQSEIKELTQLLKENPVPQEVETFEVAEDLLVVEKQEVAQSEKAAREVIELSEVEKNTLLSEPTAEGVPVKTKVSGETVVMKSTVFGSISKYKPFTVMAPQQQPQPEREVSITPVPEIKKAVKEREVRITKVEQKKEVVVHEEVQSEVAHGAGVDSPQTAEGNGLILQTPVVLEEAPVFDQKRRENIDRWLYKWRKEENFSGSSNDNKLVLYLNRGKKHFQQKNYPLALVSFNKVLTLDSEQKYAQEIHSWITQTKQHLYD